MRTQSTITQRLIIGAALAALCAFWIAKIDDEGARKDAAENALMAVNLQHHGTISLSTAAPVTPSMFREPLPAVVWAGAVAGIDAVMGPAAAEEYLTGPRVVMLKYVNVAWAAALFLVTFFAARLFTGTFGLSLLAAVLAVLPFSSSNRTYDVNHLYTDIAGAALIMASSLALAVALRKGRWRDFVVVGLCFGVLTLTKASFFYISAGLFVVLAPAYLIAGGREQLGRRAGQALLAGVACAVLVAPWMYRNHRDFGTSQIAERGGISIYTRALLDEMTADEYLGTFYAWAPRGHRPVGALLGFSEQDFDRGGRLQRLGQEWQAPFAEEDRLAGDVGRPEDAVRFLRIARAEFTKLAAELAASGDPNPGGTADRVLRDRGIEMIRGNLFAHFAIVVPLLWGIAPLTFPLLVGTFFYAASRKRFDLAVFLMPCIALVTFSVLASIFVVRYAIPVVPVAMVTAAFLAQLLWRSQRVAPLRSRMLGAVSR